MIAFPVAAGVISLAFGVHLLARFSSGASAGARKARPRERSAPHEGVWALAMLMFAAASLALALGVGDGWSSAEFRAYWLFGAVLNVPYLAQGELYLLLRDRRIGHLLFALLLAATAFAAVEIATASTNLAGLAEEFPGGDDVFGEGTVPHRLAPFYVWPSYVFLIVGILWSAQRMRARPELQRVTGGLALIALGATIVAAGSGVGAVIGNLALFSVSLAAGAATMYWGFLIAVRPAKAAPARPP